MADSNYIDNNNHPEHDLPNVTKTELRVNLGWPGKEQRDMESAVYTSDIVPRRKAKE